MRTRTPAVIALLVAALSLAACQAAPSDRGSAGTSLPVPTDRVVPAGTVAPSALAAADELVEGAAHDLESQEGVTTELVAPRSMGGAELEALVASGDQRLAWPLVDVLRFHPERSPAPELLEALADLTGAHPPAGEVAWVFYAELLLDREVPAPPGYLSQKRALLLAVDPEWSPLFDPDHPIDWREVTWSGSPPGAVTALHDPEMVGAGAGDWLPDDDPVIGIAVGGEARAYPERVLEAHGLVTDRVGDQTIVVVEGAFDDLVGAYRLTSGDGAGLRPSGLLISSRELIFDSDIGVAYDPLAGMTFGPTGSPILVPVSMVATTWGAWRDAFPDTSVVSADAGIGRVYVSSPRVEGPASPDHPVRELDARLAPLEPVITAITVDGTPVAFALEGGVDAVADGQPVEAAGLTLELKAGGLVVRDARSGALVPSQQAAWFAWSGARPSTVVWAG